MVLLRHGSDAVQCLRNTETGKSCNQIERLPFAAAKAESKVDVRHSHCSSKLPDAVDTA
jgi:hypothetical protein